MKLKDFMKVNTGIKTNVTIHYVNCDYETITLDYLEKDLTKLGEALEKIENAGNAKVTSISTYEGAIDISCEIKMK